MLFLVLRGCPACSLMQHINDVSFMKQVPAENQLIMPRKVFLGNSLHERKKKSNPRICFYNRRCDHQGEQVLILLIFLSLLYIRFVTIRMGSEQNWARIILVLLIFFSLYQLDLGAK